MTDLSTPATPPTVADAKLEQHPLHAKLDALTPQELEQRRREIIASAQGGSYKELSDEQLEELCFITSTLRRRSLGPPKAAKPAKAPAKKKFTLDDI